MGKPKISVCWEGLQFVHHSFAVINREVGIELLKSGQVDLSIIPGESRQFDVTADPRYALLADCFHRKPDSVDIHVRHQWPPSFDPPPAGRWVLMQPWEFGSLPRKWIRPIRELVDEVWVVSRYVKSVYTDSGIDPEKLHVIPNGVNPEVFRPEDPAVKARDQGLFRFLFVGGTIHRKGADILLETYLRTFTARDDVVLVIKDMGSRNLYAGHNLADQIAQIRNRPGAPRIFYIGDDLAEHELASLYRACDCLVHPYRGEGFALPVLEAMACGLPVIVTAGGSTDDFVNDDVGYRIPSHKVVFGDRTIGGEETVGDTWYLEIDRDALAERMRYVHTHAGECRRVGRRASQKATSEYSWRSAAEKYLRRMHEMVKKPVLRGRSWSA